jgi:hypothetical protein
MEIDCSANEKAVISLQQINGCSVTWPKIISCFLLGLLIFFDNVSVCMNWTPYSQVIFVSFPQFSYKIPYSQIYIYICTIKPQLGLCLVAVFTETTFKKEITPTSHENHNTSHKFSQYNVCMVILCFDIKLNHNFSVLASRRHSL